MSSVSRRVWVGAAALGAVGAGAWIGCNEDARSKPPKEGDMLRPTTDVTPLSMPMRKLGKTGAMVSAVGIGGAHLGTQTDEKESIAIIRSALDRGVTFLDNCWDYNGGKSEERMGRALQNGYRDKAFLMTKLDGRTKGAASAQLDQSLKRLGVDMIDLVQIHEIIR